MKTFKYVWWPKVEEIVGKLIIESPKFCTCQEKTCFTWCIAFCPKDSQEPERCSILLCLIDVAGVDRQLVKADFQFKITTNSSSSSKIFADFADDYFKFECGMSKINNWGRFSFARAFYNGVPENVTIFNGNRIKITCKIRIPAEMFACVSKGEDSTASNQETSKVFSMTRHLFETYVASENGRETADKLSDVTFIASDKTRFHCHRYVLASQSDVFKTMLFDNDDFDENVEPRTVTVKDIDGECMKEVLRFIYTESCGENFAKLAKNCLYAAEKYMLSELKSKCHTIMQESLTVENVLEYLISAEKYRLDVLKSLAVDLIIRKFDTVKCSDSWKTFVKDHFNLVEFILNAACRQSVIECLPAQ